MWDNCCKPFSLIATSLVLQRWGNRWGMKRSVYIFRTKESPFLRQFSCFEMSPQCQWWRSLLSFWELIPTALSSILESEWEVCNPQRRLKSAKEHLLTDRGALSVLAREMKRFEYREDIQIWNFLVDASAPLLIVFQQEQEQARADVLVPLLSVE